MVERKSFFQILKWKLVGSAVIGGLLWVTAGALGFPPIFQWMFAFYAFLGLLVFVLLDLPQMKEITGGKAILALIVFYAGCSAVYVAASSLLPQYDPAVELEKIKRVLKDKPGASTTRELYKKTQELSEKADEILARLEKLEGGPPGKPKAPAELKPKAAPGAPRTLEELVAAGKQAYNDYECYNCHKIGGKGGTKKRGPKLDNIGSFLKPEEICHKIFDPKYILAEGFEKEHKKGVMPKDYKDLISEDECIAIGTYLATLKDTSVDTPKPIFHNGEH